MRNLYGGFGKSEYSMRLSVRLSERAPQRARDVFVRACACESERGERDERGENAGRGAIISISIIYFSGKAPVAKDVLLIERRCAAQPLRMLTCVDPAATARAILGLTGCKGQDRCIMRTRILCGLLAEAPTSADRRPRERPHRVSSLGVQHPLCKRLPF